ncbi:MAG: hypothetical protein ACYDA2_10375 [Acidimicrobiales bacterium]
MGVVLLSGVALISLASPALAQGGTPLSITDQQMEGSLSFPAGSWISAGYHFSGGTIGVPVSFENAEVAVPVACSNGGPATGLIVVPLSSGPYVPTGSGNVPWQDQSSRNPPPWQGAVEAPALCGTGLMYNGAAESGAGFTADVVSASPAAIQVQFHFRIPAAKTAQNTDCDNPADPNSTVASICGASVSATTSVNPGPPLSPPTTTTTSTTTTLPTTTTTSTPGSTTTTTTVPVVQTIAGYIYDCSSGAPTIDEVPGGTISATGPSSVATTPDLLNPIPVAAGTYTMTATAPAGYHLVACGGSSSVTGSGAKATEPVAVPPAGHGVGIFYVAQLPGPGTQTIAGHIFDCSSGAPTSTEVPGGTITAAGPESIGATSNPLTPAAVPAGLYTLTATPPPGYSLVVCGGSSTVGPSGSSATEPVTVPAGGTGDGIFYVAHLPAPGTQTLAAHIFDCTGGIATGNEVPGGSISGSGPARVPNQANPLDPVAVVAGGYLVTATAPPGYSFVPCGGSTTVGTPPDTATDSVLVPAGGFAVADFFVVLAATSGSGSTNTQVTPTTVPPRAPTPPPSSTTGALAFTGVAGIGKLLVLGAALVLIGRALVRRSKRHQAPELPWH